MHSIQKHIVFLRISIFWYTVHTSKKWRLLKRPSQGQRLDILGLMQVQSEDNFTVATFYTIFMLLFMLDLAVEVSCIKAILTWTLLWIIDLFPIVKQSSVQLCAWSMTWDLCRCVWCILDAVLSVITDEYHICGFFQLSNIWQFFFYFTQNWPDYISTFMMITYIRTYRYMVIISVCLL